MTALLSHFNQGLRAMFHVVGSFLVWTLWLVLVATLGIQLWWMTARELEVPRFLLRRVEERLALSQLNATFGRTAFDPSGRILVEDVKLFSPAFTEPLLTARSVYVRVDPWSILAGQFTPSEISASGVNLLVPAMFSASGQAEPLASDLAATVLPHERAVEITQFTAHIGTLDVSAHGTIAFSPRPRESKGSLPIADFVARDYPKLSRRIADALTYLQGLEDPSLELEFIPEGARGAMVAASLSTRQVTLSQPVALTSSNVNARARFPLNASGEIDAEVGLTAESLKLPRSIAVQHFRSVLRGSFRPQDRSVHLKEAQLGAASLLAYGFSAQPLAAKVTPDETAWRAEISANLMGEPIALTTTVDLRLKTATAAFVGSLSPRVLTPASALVKRDLGALLQLARAPQIDGLVKFSPGWKFQLVSARLQAEDLVAHDVPLDFVSADVEFASTRLAATDVVLRTRGNDARGLYLMDTATQDYRILLTGHLLPTDINGWFGPWWPAFFSGFKFGDPRPQTDVDVQGRWGEPRLSQQFVQVHAPSTAIRGVAFDDVRTNLFIRPGHYDALEVLATQGTGAVRGKFLYTVTPGIGTLQSLDFDSTSTIDPRQGAKIFGDEGLSLLQPFRFSESPKLALKGRIEGPGSPNGRHENVQIRAESKGAFGLFDFPLSDVSFQADLHDDDLSVHDVKTTFAEGTVSGHARMWGCGDKRRLSFDVSLSGADLGQAVQQVEGFARLRNGQAAKANDTLFEKRGIRLDLSADAEGRYDDLFSFQGKGDAALVGTELGEVRLLGAMSELFNFTALRFTNLASKFKINGAIVEFPDLRLTGANSSVTAHGTYALDQKALDFNAKLFPFGESKFIPQLIIGAVLSPLSQILEVRLTGSLEKPAWAFVRGPTNFLRALGGSPRMAPTATSALMPSGPVRTNKVLSPYIRRSGNGQR